MEPYRHGHRVMVWSYDDFIALARLDKRRISQAQALYTIKKTHPNLIVCETVGYSVWWPSKKERIGCTQRETGTSLGLRTCEALSGPIRSRARIRRICTWLG